MKLAKRLEEIALLVDQRGYVSVQELSQAFGASLITIRRDLLQLETLQRLRRTHGGAAALNAPAPAELPQALAQAGQALPVSGRSISGRFDALITADMLPNFANLLQRSERGRPLPVIAESLPLPETQTFVSVDNYQAGQDMGRWAGQYAREHYQGQANILDLTYHRPNTQARSQGFLEGFREVLPGARLVLSINTQSRYDMAYQLTRDALSVHPDINIIFAINDVSARGANDACKSLRLPPERLVIVTIGMEGHDTLDLITQGSWIRAGVCMFPEIVGITCVEAAIAAYNHQPLPAQLITPYCIVTQESATSVYTREPQGWRLNWNRVPCELKLPFPMDIDQPHRDRPLPARLGFLYTFVNHDWYITMAHVMQEYTARLGIQLEILDFEKTMRDELYLRQVEIARRAAEEIHPGDTIFIDGGVISVALARMLTSQTNLTVITNSLEVIETLREAAEITLISTGGALRRSSQVFVGPTAEATLKEFHIDKLFLMVSGVSSREGLSHTNISEVTIKQQMIRSAREVILLADHNCFEEKALVQVAPITVVHKLITDDALPASIRLELGTQGIQVILAAM